MEPKNYFHVGGNSNGEYHKWRRNPRCVDLVKLYDDGKRVWFRASEVPNHEDQELEKQVYMRVDFNFNYGNGRYDKVVCDTYYVEKTLVRRMDEASLYIYCLREELRRWIPDEYTT